MESSKIFRSPVVKWAFWTFLIALSVLPLIQNMNDLMAKIAMATGLNVFIENKIVPPVTSMISIILRHLFGIENQAPGGSIFVTTKNVSHELHVGWNCIGWQSLVLLLFSIVTGLQGKYTLRRS